MPFTSELKPRLRFSGVLRNSLCWFVIVLTAFLIQLENFAQQLPDPQPFGKVIQKIEIIGLRKTQEEIVLRELDSEVGQPYTEESAANDYRNLDQTELFSSIKINPVVVDESVILEIEVRETIPYFPILSLDFSDENGTSVGPGLKAINLGGRAIRFSTTARFGGETLLEVSAENPWFAGNHASFETEFLFRDRYNEFGDFQEDSVEFSLRIASYLAQRGRIGGKIGFLSLQSDTEGMTLSPSDRDNIPTASFFLGYDSRDMPSNPAQGWWAEFEVQKSGGILGGSTDFWSFIGDVRRYQSVGERHTIALFSLVSMRTGSLDTEIPGYLTYYLGGANTIRGWSLNSINGKNQFIGTAEYRYSLLRRRPVGIKSFNVYIGLQVAAFADLGIAWDDRSELSHKNFIDGYGVGLRLLVPFIDVIRFDLSFGEPGSGMSPEFGLHEKADKQRKRVR